MSEDSPGANNTSNTNHRQSKRKKTVPQKVETTQPSPAQSDACLSSPEEDDADTTSPDGGVLGDVIDVDDLIDEEINNHMVVIDNSQDKSAKVKVSGGRESDGDTDEEMFFQVNKEGIYTWQGSNIATSSPVSDLGLVSAYQLEHSNSSARLSPPQLKAETDNSTNPILCQMSTDESEQQAMKKSPKAENSKTIVTKKTTKKRRRNNNGPYECKVCHKLFAQSSSRNRHTKLHYGIYDYACEVCGRQFARREHLKTHANKCPGNVMADSGPPPNKAKSTTSTIAPAASYGLLQESFGDIIMIQ